MQVERRRVLFWDLFVTDSWHVGGSILSLLDTEHDLLTEPRYGKASHF